MNKYDATEIAYKRGFENGYAKAKKEMLEVFKNLMAEMSDTSWVEIKKEE